MAQNNSTPQGSHAEAWAEVAELVATEEINIAAEAEAEALAEGMSVIARVVNSESRAAKLKSGMAELRKEIAERDELLKRAANLRKLTDMRKNIDAVLAAEYPWIAETQKELIELERQLRAHKREVDGVTVFAAAPNHPLVEKINIKKEAIANIRSRSLAALDELIHFKGLEDADALEIARLENDLWDVWKASRERK